MTNGFNLTFLLLLRKKPWRMTRQKGFSTHMARPCVLLLGLLFAELCSNECSSSLSVSRAADLQESLENIQKKAEKCRNNSPPDLPGVESLRLERLELLDRATKKAEDVNAWKEAGMQSADDKPVQSRISAWKGVHADKAAVWVSGMRAKQASDELIDRMKYIDAFVVAHLGWEPFAAMKGRKTVFGDGAAQVFKAWQAALTFDESFWDRSDGMAAAYVKWGLSLATPGGHISGKKLFEIWQHQANQDAEFREPGDALSSPESLLRDAIEKHFSGDEKASARLIEVWQSAARGSPLFFEAWQSPKSFNSRFEVSRIVQNALEMAVSNDSCHLEAVAMLAYVEKPEPSEAFQPAELRESLRKRNQQLLSLGVTRQSDGGVEGLAGKRDKAFADVMPWEAPAEYLKAKSTSFILDDLKYYTGFLDDRSPLTGKDRRGEDFSVVLGGMLLVYADDDQSQTPVVARYLPQSDCWQKLQVKLLRVGPPRRHIKKRARQDSEAQFFHSLEVEARIISLVNGTRQTLSKSIRERALETAMLFPTKKNLRSKILEGLNSQLPDDGSGDLASQLARVIRSYDNVIAAHPGVYDSQVESAQGMLAELIDTFNDYIKLEEGIVLNRQSQSEGRLSKVIPRRFEDYDRQMACLKLLEREFSSYLSFEQAETSGTESQPPANAAGKSPAGGMPEKPASARVDPTPVVSDKSLVESLDATTLINVYGSVAWLQLMAETLEKLRDTVLPSQYDFNSSVSARLKERGLDFKRAEDRAKFRSMNVNQEVYSIWVLRLRCDMLDALDGFFEVFAEAKQNATTLPGYIDQNPPSFAVNLNDLNDAYTHWVDFRSLWAKDSSLPFSSLDDLRLQLRSFDVYDPNLARVHLKMQKQFGDFLAEGDKSSSYRIDDNEWAVVSAVNKYRLVPGTPSDASVDNVDLTTILQTLPKIALAQGVDLESSLNDLATSHVGDTPIARRRRSKNIRIDVDLTMNGMSRHPLGEVVGDVVEGEAGMALKPDRISETFLVVLQPLADDEAKTFEPEFIRDPKGEEKKLSLIVPERETMVDFVVDLERRAGNNQSPAMIAKFVRSVQHGEVLGIVPLRGRVFDREGTVRKILVTARMHEVSRLPPQGLHRHFFKIVARGGGQDGRELDDQQVNYHMKDWRDLDNNMINDFLRDMADMHPCIPAWLNYRHELLRPSPGGSFGWADVVVE